MTIEHSLQADLSPEEINDNDFLKATVRKTQEKRIVSLERIKSGQNRDREEKALQQNTTVNINIKLKPEWYKVAQGLSIVLGFDSFESYVSDCIKTNIRMYLMGGDNIDEYFRERYKHLVYESEGQQKERRELSSVSQGNDC